MPPRPEFHRPIRDNSLGSDQSTPMPRDFTGGEDDFALVRMVDGHIPGTTGNPGANAHYPAFPEAEDDDIWLAPPVDSMGNDPEDY